MNQITRYHHLVLKTLPHGQRAAVLTKDEARNERFSNIDGSDSRRDLVLVKKESFLQTPDAPSFQIAQHVRNNDGAGPSANLYGLWADRNDDGVIDSQEVEPFESMVGKTKTVSDSRYLTTNLFIKHYQGQFFIAEEISVL